jgi:tetratricopeptide (TPR) repeat protein
VLFELGDLDSALESVEKAVEKSESNVMKHLYLRALIMALKGEYKEAFKGFTSVLSMFSELKERKR